MAQPNIVGVSTILGITTAVIPAALGETVILSNAANSGCVMKVNTIIAANNAKNSNNCQLSVTYHTGAAGAGSTFSIARNVGLNSTSTLIITDKASSFYLEENQSLSVETTLANNISFLVSYDQIFA